MLRKHGFHSLLVCCLTLCLTVCPCPVAAAAASPLCITVAADTHLRCAADLSAPSAQYTEHLLDPHTFGYASTQGQMDHESEAILCAMLDAFAASDSPFLLIAGDLTCGRRASHLRMAELLRRAEQVGGKQIFVINGNHDCAAESGDNNISMQEFREIYAQFGYDEAIARDADSASYAADLGETHRLLAVDSCIYGEDEGEISESVLRFILEQTEAAVRDGRTPIVMMHHSILPHYAAQPMIDKYRRYARRFADSGIGIVLTGHIHANDISCTRSDRGNLLYDIQTGSLIASPNTYRTLTFGADGVQVRSRFVTQIDTSVLPATLTPTQKAMLADDFPAYAHAYFESGVGKWFNRNLGSVDRIARWFKLRDGTAAYNAANQIMQNLGDALGQDIYGAEGSIESALAPFGVDVPASRFQKPYQAAAAVMYGFFHGDEATVSGEENVRLLLRCLEGALLSAMQNGVDDASLGSLIRSVTGKAAALSASRRTDALRDTAERMALALVQTAANGFTDDYSAPSDLDETLRFQENSGTAATHITAQIFRLLLLFLKHLIYG
ncbi:MAG: metallophosphoesterase [Clostridia bacterium]|nr:metallophosphoesterase [Clostridia bacterium]